MPRLGRTPCFQLLMTESTSLWLYLGWLLQELGKKLYGITLLTGCALLTYLLHKYIRNCVLIWSIFFKFWLGFGIGGDYSLSAVILWGPKQSGLSGFSYIGYSTLAEHVTAIFGAVAAIVAVSKMFVKMCRFDLHGRLDLSKDQSVKHGQCFYNTLN